MEVWKIVGQYIGSLQGIEIESKLVELYLIMPEANIEH